MYAAHDVTSMVLNIDQSPQKGRTTMLLYIAALYLEGKYL